MEVFDTFSSHFIFLFLLGQGLLKAEEELIDYFGAYLKKLFSLQFACHINSKQTFSKIQNAYSPCLYPPGLETEKFQACFSTVVVFLTS